MRNAGRLRAFRVRAARLIDRTINLLKWPIAVVSLYLLPKSLLAVWGVLAMAVKVPVQLLPLVAGFAGYLLVWRMVLRRRFFGSFFSTLEHELTHALFALLTLHPVTGLSATWSRGGRMSFRGDGNWLITIAPYFFPTAALAVLAVSCVLPERWLGTADGLLGMALGYHVASTIQETHRGQSDLQIVGWLFSTVFLPTANLIAFGAVLSFAVGGTEALGNFLGALR